MLGLKSIIDNDLLLGLQTMPIPLDLSALKNAVSRLDAGLTRHVSEPLDTQLRDGLVQRFEFTYEISHKMLKRYLEMSSANPSQFDSMPFADLIRTANEQGLLKGDWSDWRTYREMRSKTSHTYDEAIAVQVVRGIPAFLDEAKALLESLQERIA